MNKSIIMGVWLDFKYQPDSEWRNYFLKLKKAGIEEIFVNANVSQLKFLVELTKDIGSIFMVGFGRLIGHMIKM